VFAGTLLATKSDPKSEVAIKTRLGAASLVGEAATVADEAFLLEALLLNGLKHPGIIKLVAMVTNTAPILMCTELMINGDLRAFLRKNRSQNGEIPSVVTPTVILAMSAKLASAMAYLERAGVIHRDVAARNVLVGGEATNVKMADLGAARNVHRTSESSYRGVYTATTEHNPARWMPLEALREARFSHKSDVFAFGVLLWEILSSGQTPWGAFSVRDFSEALARGDRLQLPAAPQTDRRGGNSSNIASANDAAKTIYAIALRCWLEMPRKRPHFHQLETELAIHQTVLNAKAAPLAVGSNADSSSSYLEVVETERVGLDEDGYVEDTAIRQARVGLDDDGYVEDTTTSQTPALDESGYVDDPVEVSGVAVARPGIDEGNLVVGGSSVALDTDGYVEDTLSMPSSSIALDTDGYVEDTLPMPVLAGVAAPRVTRAGIASRAVRNPSLCLGFGESDKTVRGLHPDETRL
jgi:hypothetical protein